MAAPDPFRILLDYVDEIYRAMVHECTINKKQIEEMQPDDFIWSIMQKMCECYGSEKVRFAFNEIFDFKRERIDTQETNEKLMFVPLGQNFNSELRQIQIRTKSQLSTESAKSTTRKKIVSTGSRKQKFERSPQSSNTKKSFNPTKTSDSLKSLKEKEFEHSSVDLRGSQQLSYQTNQMRIQLVSDPNTREDPLISTIKKLEENSKDNASPVKYYALACQAYQRGLSSDYVCTLLRKFVETKKRIKSGQLTKRQKNLTPSESQFISIAIGHRI